MTLIAQFLLFGWIPIVLMLFLALPPRRALVAATIAAWLSLPNVSISLPGVPDYSKTSATVMGILLGSALFDPGRVFTFRPRWIDLPMLAWCLGPFFTSLSNDLGAYDGVSQVLKGLVQWGLPYFLGRVYLADFAGMRELAVGIVVGGLVYVPLCLFEIRFSPQLQNWIFGSSLYWEGRRYGGFRPKVFMATGIELGMWMTAATLIGWWLRTNKSLKRLWGWSFGMLLLGLTVTTIMCKSTGALLLLGLGFGVLWVVKRTKSPLLVLALVLLPALYMGARVSGLMSGRPLVAIVRSVLNEERAQSLETRFRCEDIVVAKALQRPILGWGGYSRIQEFDESGRSSTFLDGLWMIVFGQQGFVGLVGMTLAFALPVLLFLKRYPARIWTNPTIAPTAAMAVLLSLYMIDNLSNAFANLAYAIGIGGLSGLVSAGKGRGIRAGGTDPIPGEDRTVAGQGPVPADRRAELADRQDVLADTLWSQGLYDDAERALQLALKLRQELAADHLQVAEYRQDLALAFENLGRLLKARRRPRETEETWLRALEIRASLVTEFPDDEGCRRSWANVCNDLAWLLAISPDAASSAASRAVRLAETAVELLPSHQTYWNTLGLALYRRGNWNTSAIALKKSIELGSGGSGFDHFILAMAYRRLGQTQLALASYHRACRWLQEHNPGHAELLRLQSEAANLLGI
jgi:tetratricopeptide (TPR) repeat protein